MSATAIQMPSGIPVVERLAGIVQALHDTLRELGSDTLLSEAAREFPSARQRLLHIASLTENAANLVLTKVEDFSPRMEQMSARAAEMQRRCESEGADAAELQAFFAQIQRDCGDTRGALSDMMMAQDFQDLTGQLIKKVVLLMERTENDLLKVLLDALPPDSVSAAAAVAMAREDEIMAGPGAPGSVALAQDNVDDLLADLGF